MIKKKCAAMLCAACLIASGTAVLPQQAAVCAAAEKQPSYDGLLYESADGEVTITGYTDDLPEDFTVPAEIGGMPVTKIGAEAFSYCSKLKSVVIPETVREIGAGAFKSCYWLELAVLPDTMIRLPCSLFEECKRLETVQFSPQLESIGDMTFARCEMLADIAIPACTVDIGEDAFAGTAWLKAKRAENPFVIVNRILIDGQMCEGDVTIPAGADYIGAGAFSYNRQIVNVVIPAHVKAIRRYGFFYCPALKSMTILNPECEIYDMDGTISNQYAKHKAGLVDGVIRGFEHSTAQEYAVQHEFPFECLETEEFLRGDWNGNGKVDVSDAQDVLNAYTASLADMTAEVISAQKTACDINGDGQTDILDAQLILLYAVSQSVAETPVTWDNLLQT